MDKKTNKPDKVFHFMMYHPSSGSKLRGQVACIFCNRRKLKCTKTKPCKECSKRNLECLYVHELPTYPSIHSQKIGQDQTTHLDKTRLSLLNCCDYYSSIALYWKSCYDTTISTRLGNSRNSVKNSSNQNPKNSFDSKILENNSISKKVSSPEAYINQFIQCVKLFFPDINIKLSENDNFCSKFSKWFSVTPTYNISYSGKILERSTTKSIVLSLEYSIMLGIGAYCCGDLDISQKYLNWSITMYYHLIFRKQITIYGNEYLKRFTDASIFLSLHLRFHDRESISLIVLNNAYLSAYQNEEIKNTDMFNRLVLMLLDLSKNDNDRFQWIEYIRRYCKNKVIALSAEILNIFNKMKMNEELQTYEGLIESRNIMDLLKSKIIKTDETRIIYGGYYKSLIFIIYSELNSRIRRQQESIDLVINIFDTIRPLNIKQKGILPELIRKKINEMIQSSHLEGEKKSNGFSSNTNNNDSVFHVYIENNGKKMSLAYNDHHTMINEEHSQEINMNIQDPFNSKVYETYSDYFSPTVGVLYG